MSEPTRWVTDNEPTHSQWYVDHFRRLASEGADLDGEARFMDALLARHARVLDGGCGQGRTGGALHRRGHTVVGVDADPVLIEAARVDNPGPTWVVDDLATMDLTVDEFEPFDVAVLAGNVISFVTPGTEAQVLRNVARHLKDSGLIVTGFHLSMCDLATYDAAVADAGLTIRNRFATWDVKPWPGNDAALADDDIDFCVTVLQRS